ncbi:MAG: putative DNA binding domain-containing protein [Prolixibacteraceae bacterium]|nr:putative DNA binding domain-containing protein [Prolixibacteraceae bacterium]
MNPYELKIKLSQLLSIKSENEIVEFKEANNNYDFVKLGKYFSALSNEANLLRKECSWLVFGVEDKSHKIVGTKYRENRTDLDNLKKEIADRTSNRITFQEIYELKMPEGRVVLFQIPPAPKGLPISFDGHFYGRDGESLVPLNLEEIERIRNQVIFNDWTAQIIQDATIEDLDELAIKKARVEFSKRNPKYAEDIDSWDDRKFLDKAKLTIKGKITRTALILLGKDEAEHFLGSFVKIRWNLKTIDNQDKDFEIFSIPFILAIDEVNKRIRNLKYRYLQEGTLFPDEVLRYAPFSIRESLNNAIAHQDYTKAARINVVEFEDDHLVFSNYGAFLPCSIENVVLNDTPEEIYRNPFLVEAMKNLDMIETQGGGIRKLFNFQRQRFFPMPEYDISGGKVKVTIVGKIVDEEFARILAKNPNLSIEDIILLDKVQKTKPVTDTEYKHLKKLRFIEGRKNNPYLSFKIVHPSGDPQLKADYIKNRGLEDEFIKKYLFDYIKMGKVSRKDIDKFIWGKLPDVLDDKKKKNKIMNLLQELRKEGKITSPEYGIWV